MRRAGRYALHVLRELWPEARHVKVYCGSGNNAGDGYILAGLALNSGLSATVVQIGKSSNLEGDALQAFEWYKEQANREGAEFRQRTRCIGGCVIGNWNQRCD